MIKSGWVVAWLDAVTDDGLAKPANSFQRESVAVRCFWKL